MKKSSAWLPTTASSRPPDIDPKTITARGRDPEASDIGEREARCHHCDLPLPVRPVRGSDSPFAFCCPACLAAYQAIRNAGLEDFYRLRAGRGAPCPAAEPDAALRHYDHPEVQKGFVHARDGRLSAHLGFDGIRCAACCWLIEQRLRRLPGVSAISVDPASETAELAWEPGRVRLSGILAAVEALGYRARPFDASHRHRQAELRRHRSTERLLFAGLAGMPVMHVAMASYLLGTPPDAPELWEWFGRWASLIATVPILFWAGQEFFSGAWRDLRNRRPGMDVPIVLGLVAAFVASVVATLLGRGEVYYDSVVMFVFLVLLARRLELRGRERAAAPLDRLARIEPRTARRLRADGGEEEVAVPDLVPGDRLRVLPGETLGADGEIVEGASRFDEAVLSGEPHPVWRGPGARVIGGARNLEQAVTVRVLRPARESVLGEVYRLLRQGLAQRPRPAVLADRVVPWFIAGLLLVATLTAAAWMLIDPARAVPVTISVLIVTCPCALALAVPSAYAVGLAGFAERGLLAVRPGALDALAEARVAVFDKTGTLTEPRLQLAASWSRRDDLASCLQVAAALECDAVHPLAAAFPAPAAGAPRTEAHRALPGGVEGRVAGEHWALGSLDFVAARVSVSAALMARARALEAEHGRVVALADTDAVRALFALDERVRPEAAATLHGLRADGIERIVLLSGDPGPGVARLGAHLALDEVRGACSPQDKLTYVRRLQKCGTRVLAVGDGINDAPLLGGADVSVAVPGAADLARVGSDLVLLEGGLHGLVEARGQARALGRIVRQNLVWALGYNLVAVPAAALGFVTPWGAALGMALSSMLVVGNSLRLVRVRPAAEPAATGTPAGHCLDFDRPTDWRQA